MRALTVKEDIETIAADVKEGNYQTAAVTPDQIATLISNMSPAKFAAAAVDNNFTNQNLILEYNPGEVNYPTQAPQKAKHVVLKRNGSVNVSIVSNSGNTNGNNIKQMRALKTAYISEGIGFDGNINSGIKSPFYGRGATFEIYTVHNSKPILWSNYFNYVNANTQATVHYGVTLEEYLEIVE